MQIWYVEVRISRSISGSSLEFEITRVDCIWKCGWGSTQNRNSVSKWILQKRFIRYHIDVYCTNLNGIRNATLQWITVCLSERTHTHTKKNKKQKKKKKNNTCWRLFWYCSSVVRRPTGPFNDLPDKINWIFFFFFFCGQLCPLTLSALQTRPDTRTNNVDPDETAHNVLSHQDLHCLPFVLIFDWHPLFAVSWTCQDTLIEKSTL